MKENNTKFNPKGDFNIVFDEVASIRELVDDDSIGKHRFKFVKITEIPGRANNE